MGEWRVRVKPQLNKYLQETKSCLIRWIHIHLRFLFIDFVSVNNHRVAFYDAGHIDREHFDRKNE